MAVLNTGLLSQYAAQMPSLSRPQGRKWMIVLAVVAIPFFMWSLWSLEIGRTFEVCGLSYLESFEN